MSTNESKKDWTARAISYLNKENFNNFIYHLWNVDSVNNDAEIKTLSKKTRLGEGVFEQNFIIKDTSSGCKAEQGFNLIIPFSQPIDLILNTDNLKLVFDEEVKILKSYSSLMRRRMNKWFWPQDGELILPNLYFVSNIHGVTKQKYFEKILPRLQSLIKTKERYSGVGIGTCDSFVDQVPDKAEIVLKSMFFKEELSFSYQEDRIRLNKLIKESYLKSGVLKGTLSPCDTVISFSPSKHIEVFKEFEHLLNGSYKEAQLEQFLRKYFRQIFGNKYDRIETQLWLRFPELDLSNKNRRLDMFLRNAVDGDWELLELKPTGSIVSNKSDVPTLSSRITKAIAQLKNYERILQQDNVKKKLQRQGIEYYEPQLRLIVGGNPDIPHHQWQRIKKENSNGFKLMTCDDVFREMKSRYDDFVDFYRDNNL